MKILLATDGAPCSEAALNEVAERPWPVDSQVRVITAVGPHGPLVAEPWLVSTGYFEEVEKVERQQAEVTLERAAAKLRDGTESSKLEISTRLLKGSPKRAIVEEAESWGADLIVVGSHDYHTWERMLLGSVSQTVTLHAPCSVEVVRADG